MRDLTRIRARLAEPLALTAGKLAEIAEVLAARPGRSSPGRSESPGWYPAGSVAVVPVAGTLVRATGGIAAESGLMSYAEIAASFRAAIADPATQTVLLHLDSYGGEVAGLFPLADEIYAARGTKPIIALADEVACSAAYCLAAAADRVILASPIAQVGSIGVIAQHIDQSRADQMAGLTYSTLSVGARKADGSPHAPLSEEARAVLMARLEMIYGELVSRVARYRGLAPGAIAATEAAVVSGAEALQLGLADEIQAPGALLVSLQVSATPARSDMKTLSLPASHTQVAAAAAPAGPIDSARLAQVRALAETHSLSAVEALDHLLAPQTTTAPVITSSLVAHVRGSLVGRPGSAVISAVEALDMLSDPVLARRAAEGQAMLGNLRADEAAIPHLTAAPSAMGGGISVGADYSDPNYRRERMAEALAARLNPRLAPSEAARDYMGLSVAEMAGSMLEDRGVRVRGMNRARVIEAAMSGGWQGTRDFPHLLNSAATRALAEAYQAAPSAIKTVARKRLANDYRPLTILRMSEAPRLREVPEHGEIKHGAIGEGAESYRIREFGVIFGLTRQALINDDLSAFGDWTIAAGQAAADCEAEELAKLLSENAGLGPVLEDGKTLFHADHGNLGVGGVLSVLTLGAGRQAMREQTGLDGKTPISATPRYLLVGPALETPAEQILAEIAAATSAETNPFAGKLTLLVEPRLRGNQWRLFASPETASVLEYAYLTQAEGPQILTREGWERSGLEMRVTLDFGAGAVGSRGAFLNPGL